MIMRPCCRVFAILLPFFGVCAQDPVEEMTTRETPATFKSKVNLVLVPVIVRDHAGRTIGHLRREDFQLLDRGKPQIIASFSEEKDGVAAAIAQPVETQGSAETAPPPGPDRFVAYLFDDMHVTFSDLVRVRTAAEQHVDKSLRTSDRAAVFTSSGQSVLDFTDDRVKLRETIERIRPRSTATPTVSMDCPPEVSHYLADRIQNQNDREALGYLAALEDACGTKGAAAEAAARMDASRALELHGRESRIALNTLREVVRRVSMMPGRRVIVFVSSGFLALENQHDRGGVLDLAVRSGVIISTIDARGLYGPPEIDASDRGVDFSLANRKAQYQRMGATAQEAVLAELADGTGGTLFHNRNDLDEGFRRAAARPEYMYVLGFSPQNLKLDGRFHDLKVTVREPKGLGIQARRGYFAPTRLEDAAEQAKEEIREAIFSREEIRDLPVELHTQFFKPSDDRAKLAVLVRVDVKQLQFLKADGRNKNDLTIVSALFDRNGNYVTGVNKVLLMRLKDETLQARLKSGITVKNSFEVKPGSYVIRLVVRDSEGQLMVAQNGAVEIP